MKKNIRKICLVATVFALAIVYAKSYEEESGTRVSEFNNYYNEESIEIFYEPIRDNTKINEKISKIEKIYSVKEVANTQEAEIDKILKTTEILNLIGEVDGIKESKYLNAYDILDNKDEQTKKLSGRDMAIIQRDLILALGYESRIGNFKKAKPQFEKNAEYYIVEYWSPTMNKWILIDFNKKGYIKKGDEILGAIEFLKSDINDVQFNGKSKNKDYKKAIKPYLSSYTIPIDNTVSGEKSNTFITYVKSSKDVDLLSEKEYLPPTIFTKNEILYELTPWSGKKKDDKKAYIVLMKKELEEEQRSLKDEELDKAKNKFILGSFKNGKMLKSYYLKVNDGEYIKIEDKYTEVTIEKGKNKISISENGKDESSCMEITRK